jgi:hypothetical protein
MISPFGNVTVLPEAKWHPEPTIRGTSSILSSCLITMALCTWTALHLNVPQHKNESRQVYRKMLWLALGLFAPEVVVWNAWKQRSKTKVLSRGMRSLGFMAEETNMCQSVRGWVRRQSIEIQVFLLLKCEDLPELAGPHEKQKLSYDRIHPWTDVHSWYATMGGLAFEDTAAEEFQFMPGDRRRMTLTKGATLWMARNQPRLLPDISKGHIQDKSKSGGLGKFLTCWQATYFCAQCVFRLSRQYSISLLELNVFAHALCALMLFWIWWDKPQDVQEATLITDNDGLDLCAYFCLRSKDRSTSDLEWHSPAGYHSESIPCEPRTDYWEINTPASVTTSRQRGSGYFAQAKSLSLGPNHQPCLKVLNTFWTIEAPVQFWVEGTVYDLDSRHINRLVRAYRLAKVEETHEYRNGMDSVVKDRCAEFAWEQLSSFSRDMDSVTFDSLFSSRNLRTAAGLTLAGACYGGLHLTAWACQFPSSVETMLWRAASVTILATGPTIIIFALHVGVITESCSSMYTWLKLYHIGRGLRRMLECFVWVDHEARFMLYYLWAVWYILCRAFIVVECFIMLAHIPDTTLEIPRWATYIPHIT